MPLTNIIIWRHAEAELVAATGLDADRALTQKGLADAQHMAAWLKKQLPEDVQVYCSPALRCRQTLDALLELSKKKNYSVAYSEVLAIESHFEKILPLLSKASTSTVLLVGHQPLLGELVAGMLFTATENSFAIKKGAVWWLRHQQNQAVAALLTSPKLQGKMEVLAVQHPKFFR